MINEKWAWACSLRPVWLPASKAIQTKGKDWRGPEGEKRKGRLGQTQRVCGSCAASNPLGTRGAGKAQLYRQSSQLPNNVPCTDPVSQAIALTQGGGVVNQNSLLPDRLSTGEWVCTQHCAWPLLLCCTTVAAILGKRWTGCRCLLAGISASLTTL